MYDHLSSIFAELLAISPGNVAKVFHNDKLADLCEVKIEVQGFSCVLLQVREPKGGKIQKSHLIRTYEYLLKYIFLQNYTLHLQLLFLIAKATCLNIAK